MTARESGDLALHVDGSRPLTQAEIEAVLRLCDRVEDGLGAGFLTVYLSGAPYPGWAWELSVGLLTKWERAVRRLERSALLTIAVVAGDCGGAALDMLLATDVRIAVAGARLVLPTVGKAVWPSMALYRLARQIGTARLRREALLGTRITTDQAVAAGLINYVVDQPDEVLAEVAVVAGAIAGTELAIRRQLLLDAAENSFEEALGSHLAACDRVLRQARRVLDEPAEAILRE